MKYESLNQRETSSQKELGIKKNRRWLWLILAAALAGGGVVVANEIFEKEEVKRIEFKSVPKCRECGSVKEKKKEKPKEELLEEEKTSPSQERIKCESECRYV